MRGPLALDLPEQEKICMQHIHCLMYIGNTRICTGHRHYACVMDKAENNDLY